MSYWGWNRWKGEGATPFDAGVFPRVPLRGGGASFGEWNQPDVAHVHPWTTSFNPGTTTLARLVELAHEMDFAVFIFARDDWTAAAPEAASSAGTGQDSPRDNVVFEAGLFGGVLGMPRTFILHARGSKLPSDLLGLTCVRTVRR